MTRVAKGFATFALSLFAAGCVTVHESGHTDVGDKLGSLRSDGPRKRVIVLPIINDSIEKDPSIAHTARESLVSGLRMTDNYIILDNGDIPKDLKQFLKPEGYDIDEVAKIATEAGAVAIIEGRVLEVKARRTGDEVGLIRQIRADVQASIGVKVYSAMNHREILNETRSANSEAHTHHIAGSDTRSLAADPDLIRDALHSAFWGTILPITKAIDKINWNGRIALVNGDRIYLNAGRITGINIGDILRVSEEGEEVFDPNTGTLIGKAPGRMKGTLEVVSYFGKDGCITVIHSGSGFKENDKVELY